jgi:ATP-dependent phosphofructokinase / diphosphate-dependent phosphofructokinase
MRVGILTGGGDCPGLNAVIRAAVRKGIFHHNDEFVGFIEGWRGVVENKTMPLTIDTVSGILQLGGTILRTSRTNPRKMEGGIDKCLASIKANRLDALITIGGDDTQGVANALVQKGIKVVGVPKTIDNDLSGTDACFGFDTAVSIATEAVDRLHSTAEAHNRVIVCESQSTSIRQSRSSKSATSAASSSPSSWSRKARRSPVPTNKPHLAPRWTPSGTHAWLELVKPLPS